MNKKPFQNFEIIEDITKCVNDECDKRFDCLRYMSKSEPYWQSMTKFNNNDCEHYIPYTVWSNADGKKFLLREIGNDYLKNIIKHLEERVSNIKDKELELYVLKSKRLLEEFKKEAKLRNLI